MTTNTTPARPSLVNTAINLIIIGFVLLMGYLLWPFAVAQWQGVSPAQLPVQPTAIIRPQAAPLTVPRPQQEAAPMAAPINGIAQNAATAQAMFDAAVQAGEQVPNVDNTGDPAPVLLITKPSAREGAGENVPTAEPLVQTNDQFGSKQKPVNIQDTHTCLHGQVWNGKGCRNP